MLLPQDLAEAADECHASLRDLDDLTHSAEYRSLTREEVDAKVEKGDGVVLDEVAIRLRGRWKKRCRIVA